jgi:hypothetical protein
VWSWLRPAYGWGLRPPQSVGEFEERIMVLTRVGIESMAGGTSAVPSNDFEHEPWSQKKDFGSKKKHFQVSARRSVS